MSARAIVDQLPDDLREEAPCGGRALSEWLLRAATRYAKEQQRSRARIDRRTYRDRVKRRQQVKVESELEVRR